MTWRRTSPCSPDTGFAEDAAGRETRFILWVILALNWAVAAAKLGYGLLTGAVSMQADGIHSSFDGMSNVIGLIGLWVAAHPPDARYPYGHKKYETFAAAGIGLLLFGTCLYILYSSYLHWRNAVAPDVTALSFVVMLSTMGVNAGEASRSLADKARIDPAAIREIALTVQGVDCCNDIRTRGLARHIFMDFTIHVDPAMTTAHAHTVAHQVEETVKREFPDVVEVVVHVAPEDHG